MFLAADNRLLGYVAVADPIKSSPEGAVKSLKGAGVHVIQATGDALGTARAGDQKLGLGDVDIHANLKPEDKAGLVTAPKAQGKRVGLAGDGVNDAPALATADVGIAMGTGTDVAMESAGVTLVKRDLSGVARAAACPGQRCATSAKNLALSFAYNVAAFRSLRAAFIPPFIGRCRPPSPARPWRSHQSVSVIAYSLRLARVKL